VFTFASATPAAASTIYKRSTVAPQAVRTLNAKESALLNNIVVARAAAGLPRVILSNGLIDLARSRSTDMARRGYFSHYTPEGTTFLNMLNSRGIGYRMAGEIIAQNNYPSAHAASQAYIGFMNSGEHHAIMMMGNWTQVGVGQAVDSNGMYYFTVLFKQP